MSNTDGVANSYLFIYAAGSRSDTDSPLLKTMHALLLHVGISEKVSYDLCTLAWLIVVVWHTALWRAPHTPHSTPLASPHPTPTTSTAPHHTL